MGHTHKHCALSQWRGVGCVKKRMLTNVKRKREDTMLPRSNLLLEVQTVKPLELLDEGLTLQIDLSSAFLDYKLLVLPWCPHAPWYE